MKTNDPITIATNSFFSKLLIKKYLDDSSTNIDPNFKLHDFGYRGVSSEETAGLGAMAHLINFMGTDTIAGILYSQQYYNAGDMPAFSVPASEHSTMTIWGKDHEDDAIMNMLTSYPDGLVSIVADSWDVYSAAERISKGDLKKAVLARKGTVVLRPDSGNPLEVINKLLNILWNGFGGSYNEKGYKVLDSHIRIIQGDGIDYTMIDNILKMMLSIGFAAENITFGSGGGLLQKFDRDTQKFAIKACYGERQVGVIDNRLAVGKVSPKIEGFVIYKEPITQPDKNSKRGILKLIPHSDYGFSTISSSNIADAQFNSYVDALETVFENGEIVKEYTFDEIRERVNKWLWKADVQLSKSSKSSRIKI